MIGVGVFSLTRKETNSSKCSTKPILSIKANNSLSVGLLVTKLCFFDAA
jgi:hypothetical protein